MDLPILKFHCYDKKRERAQLGAEDCIHIFYPVYHVNRAIIIATYHKKVSDMLPYYVHTSMQKNIHKSRLSSPPKKIQAMVLLSDKL